MCLPAGGTGAGAGAAIAAEGCTALSNTTV